MATRIANPHWFRAEGALIPWSTMLRLRLARLGDREKLVYHKLKELIERASQRPSEVHLRWSCASELGVPFEPFTVWARHPRDAPKEVSARLDRAEGGVLLRWGFVAAHVEVECDVFDPARAVGLFASRGGGSLREAVGAAAVRAPGGGRVTLRVRTSGATRALLVNGANPVLRCVALEEVVNDDAWEPLEHVGLPADDPWGGTAYRPSPQGLVSTLTDPVSAAMERLERGGPPFGWFPLTGTGRLAPPWVAPDYRTLVEEVRRDVLPQIERLYRPGLVPPQQGMLLNAPTVDGPRSNGQASKLSAHVELPPLALLTLPAVADPFLALAMGFGTAYDVDQREGLARADFLVTAEYEDTPRGGGPATVAAFVPAPAVHGEVAAPMNLVAERAGLVAPEERDRPWRETVRVSWDRVPGTAALGRPASAALARFDAGATEAECLLPQRDAGDFRPLITVPDGPEGTPGRTPTEGWDRTAFVDAAATIPLGSGGRSVGYPTAVQDVFGVWSRWEDGLYVGTEPAPPIPRVIALALTAAYAGSPACPATLEVEVSVDWTDRTPVQVDLAAVFFPMATATTPPPAAAAPTGPAPPGGFRRDLALPFAGEALSAPPDVDVVHLNSGGDGPATPGADQGNHGRRYRLRVPVPTLDFSATRRWGVRVWVRSRLSVLPGPTPWSPAPERPALASAASPVPVEPLPLPLPPGVPLGSTPDAEGRSHARVGWMLPPGADARKVVVWEVAESALRQAAGLPVRAPEGTLPGVRLQQLWSAYDGLAPGRRRSVFRRLQELPGTSPEADVTLPKGSADIHLFAVTTVTSTGVESPWPGGAAPHERLQAAMAPRLLRPAAPRLRAVVGEGGAVTLTLQSASRVDVREFRLYRTRSPVAARSSETMGPPFAVVTATPPGVETPPDPITGEKTYSGTWLGTFDGSWDEWFVRAVAVPVDVVPTEAVRGVPSAACEPVTVTVLPSSPDLEPLEADVWGPSNDGVVVRSATSAPARAVALGSHRLSGAAGGSIVSAIKLEDVEEGAPADPTAPPAGVSPGPLLIRGPRAGGRTPIELWFTRPLAADPVEVTLRMADPLGRVTERHLTVPGWEPPPPVSFELLDVFRIVGRGVVLRLRSDASLDVRPPYILEVEATPLAWWQRLIPVVKLPHVNIPQVNLPKVKLPPVKLPPVPLLMPRPVRASFVLPEIPRAPLPVQGATSITAVRTTDHAPHQYQLHVRLQQPYRVAATLVSPDGTRQQVSTEVR